MGPEHTAKHELTQWLDEHDIDVYWEQSSQWNHPTFSAHGTGDKPDMILQTDGLTLVIEFKSGPPYIGALLSTNLDKNAGDHPAVLWNEGESNQNWRIIG